MKTILITDIENPVVEHEGVYLVDKPKGWTSFDVVAKVRNSYRNKLKTEHESRGFCTEMQSNEAPTNGANRTKLYDEQVPQDSEAAMRSEKRGVADSVRQQSFRCKCRIRVGHSGTLDPLATGLLIVLVGKEFTQQQDTFMKQDKVYETTAVFGEVSDTYDAEGTITSLYGFNPYSDRGLPDVSREEIEEALEQFRGEISQVPPAYSAIKVNGQKAYDLARAGKDVALTPRKVVIHEFEITNYDWPEVSFRISCSSGTYIRSLVHDLGGVVGVVAYVMALRRQSSGQFVLAH